MKKIIYYYSNDRDILIESVGGKGNEWAALESFLEENATQMFLCDECSGVYPEHEISDDEICKNCQDVKWGYIGR